MQSTTHLDTGMLAGRITGTSTSVSDPFKIDQSLDLVREILFYFQTGRPYTVGHGSIEHFYTRSEDNAGEYVEEFYDALADQLFQLTGTKTHQNRLKDGTCKYSFPKLK